MSSTSFSSTESLGGNNFLNMGFLCAWLGLAPHVGQVDDEGEPGIFRFVHNYLI
jgi:hypothetical protein